MLLNFLSKLFEKCFFNISKSQNKCLKNHIKESVQASFNNYENETYIEEIQEVTIWFPEIRGIVEIGRRAILHAVFVQQP